MTVQAPTSATQSATGNIRLTFSKLRAGVRYLGAVAYSGKNGMPAPTLVEVNP
jgi:hypothetical protein